MLEKHPPQSLIRIPAAFAAAGAPCANAAEAAGAATGPVLITVAALAGAAFLTLLARRAGASLTRRISRGIGRRRIYRTLELRAIDVLDDFILPGAYGGLTRIHYAALTTAGIICVHAKHCQGTVSGDVHEPQWLNDCGDRRQQFLNPVIQNEGHVKTLSGILPDVPLINVVVFTGAMRFATPTSANVVHVASLGRSLDALLAGAGGAGAANDLNEAWRTLRASALTDTASRKDLDAQLSFG
jgi:hypothetical protein